ncbi:hypothetical protein [Jiulongibacter sp. NS-SX5]|uniref:hypothetical protein n=1 Tax=Jiulongibacter sp. NS-SX5 TaxID=3463854 RepID=UPI004058587B
MLRNKTTLFSLISILTIQLAFGQGQGNTPYSTFGYGELAEVSSASQDMMGGTGASFANAFYVNQINPALLVKNRVAGGLKYVSFNVGFRGNSRTITSGDLSQNDFGFNLDNLSLSIPVTSNYAIGASIRPYSMVDYTSVTNERVIGDEDQVFTKTVDNNGGITRVALTNSVRLFNKVYLGAELNYNFGTISKDSSSFLFGNTSNQLRTNTRYTMGGAGLKFGAAFQQKLNDKWQINVGGAFEKSSELNGDVLRTFGSYADVGNGPFITRVPDTLSNTSFALTTPEQFRVGISLESPFKWVFAADYHTTRWSGTKNLDQRAEQVKNNTEEYKFGLEYLPNSSSTKFLNQVFYRLGYARAKTAYVINGTEIMDNRFTMGASIPMGFRSPSYVNIGLGLGNRGIPTNNLIRENYVRLSISATLMSPWFIQPKID